MFEMLGDNVPALVRLRGCEAPEDDDPEEACESRMAPVLGPWEKDTGGTDWCWEGGCTGAARGRGDSGRAKTAMSVVSVVALKGWNDSEGKAPPPAEGGISLRVDLLETAEGSDTANDLGRSGSSTGDSDPFWEADVVANLCAIGNGLVSLSEGTAGISLFLAKSGFELLLDSLKKLLVLDFIEPPSVS